jgi:hypothetical protein
VPVRAPKDTNFFRHSLTPHTTQRATMATAAPATTVPASSTKKWKQAVSEWKSGHVEAQAHAVKPEGVVVRRAFQLGFVIHEKVSALDCRTRSSGSGCCAAWCLFTRDSRRHVFPADTHGPAMHLPPIHSALAAAVTAAQRVLTFA